MEAEQTPPAHTPSAHTTEFTILMALLISIVAISIDALLPALGFISADLQFANRNHAQYLIVGIFGGLAIGQLVCGPLSDALGRKKILYGGIVLYLAGSVVCYVAQSLEGLLIGRVIQGLGVAGPYVSAVSIVRDKYSGRHMARVMSVIMMVFMTVPAIAPSLGQAVLFAGSWRGIFVLYIVYAVIVGTWIFFRLEETLPKEKRIPFHTKNIIEGFQEVFRTKASLLYMTCMGFSFGGLMGYLNSSQQIFQELFGAGKMFTVYFGGLAVVLALSSFANSKLVGKYGMRYICARAFSGMIFASVIFLALQSVMDVQLWMFLIYAAILFFCFGLTFGNLNALAMEPMGHIAGTASAVIGSISSLISLVLGASIGQLYDGTLIPISCGFAVMGSIALALLQTAQRFSVGGDKAS